MKITQTMKINLYKQDLVPSSKHKTYKDELSFSDFKIEMDIVFLADEVAFISLDESGNFVGAQTLKSRKGL